MSKEVIIFLDIDGVLQVDYGEKDEFGHLFKQSYVENLDFIIEKTNAKIVISSSWGDSGMTVIQELWKKRNLPGIVIGIIPDVKSVAEKTGLEFYELVDRGHQIQQYINDNKISNYCIIDDFDDVLESQKHRFVKTSENNHPDATKGYGLTKNCSKKVIEILTKKTAD